MSSEQPNSTRMIVFIALFFAITSVAISYATYVRLSDNMDKNHIITKRIQQDMQNSIKKHSDAIANLSNRNSQPVIADVTDESNLISIINHINTQNKVIEKILGHNESMQNQIAQLKLQTKKSDEYLPVALQNSNQNYNESNLKSQEPVSIEYLEQEMELINKQEEELSRKTESIFQKQSQEGIWAAETNLLIQNSLDKIRTEQQFINLGVNNIDCREFMCKVDVTHEDPQHLEEFDLLFLLEVSGDQPLTSTTITRSLGGGGVSSTYYLSSK